MRSLLSRRPARLLLLALAAVSAVPALAQTVAPGGVFLADGSPFDAAYGRGDLDVDGQGGLHAMFYLYSYGDGHPNYYGYCAPGADCTDRSAWHLVRLTDGMPFAQIEVTPAGAARVLLYDDDATVGGQYGTAYRFATCERACGDAASWSVGDLWMSRDDGGLYTLDHAPRGFALDPAGRPRFVYHHGTEWTGDTYSATEYYAACDVGCADAANWRRVRLPDYAYADDLERTATAVTPDGRPVFVSVHPATDDSYWLAYVECTSACDGAGVWTTPSLIFPLGETLRASASWTLALDAQGRPRVAVAPGEGPMWYIWCEDDCTAPAGSWFGYSVTFGSDDERAPSIALDRQGRPRIAFQETSALGYAWCDADCEAAGSVWHHLVVEPSGVFDAEIPVPVLPDCIDGGWLGGYRPTLVLDGADQPRVVYDGQYLMRCYDDPQRPNPGATHVEARWWASRVVFFAHPGTTTPVEDGAPSAAGLHLHPVAPNPVRGAATLRFDLPKAGSAIVAVYDLLGREVGVLHEGQAPAGEGRLTWDASGLAPGVYVVRIVSGGASAARTVVVSH